MRSRQQILAEVVDSLVQQGDGRTPPEIGRLTEIGARLHNECPDADAEFLQRLQERLQAEWAPRGRVQLLLAALTGWLPRPSPRLLRATVGALVVAVLLVALSAAAPMLRTAQAGLGHTISLFQQALIKQQPAQPSTPRPRLETSRTFYKLEEAQAAAGFAIRAPAYLPRGLALLSIVVTIDRGRERVILRYASPSAQIGPQRDYVTIQQYQANRTASGAAVTLGVDLSGVERLEVAGRTALWIPAQASAAGSQSWQEHGNDLLVQDGEILIQLVGSTDRDESVRIAESMFR